MVRMPPILGFLLLLCLCAYAKEPDIVNYVPGGIMTSDRYKELQNDFFQRWENDRPFEASMKRAVETIEPEALLGAIKILSEKNRKVTYARFDPIYTPKDGHEVHSGDGLLGFRVVRQFEVETKAGTRLLSSIQNYDWSSALQKMVPVGGVDSFRVRVQVDDFVPAKEGQAARGFVGFSWATDVDKKGVVAKVRATVNVTDDKSKWLSHGHVGSYHPNGGSCSWPLHCNVCHHMDSKSAVNNFNTRPLERKGTRDFLTYLEKQRNFGRAELTKVEETLSNAETAFPTDDLRKALIARWKEQNPDD